jgi:Protein of unknown function (DUF4197)
MDQMGMKMARRTLLTSAAAFTASLIIARPLQAGLLDGSSLKSMLGNASDKALDKLAKPGAFYADTAVRVLLPGTTGKFASKLMKAGDKLGLTTKLTKSLNDAASLAALEAKPVFRSAVNGMTLNDVPGIVAKSDGGTKYLQKSAGSELYTKVRPLIMTALNRVGAYSQLAKLNKTAGSLMGMTKLNDEGLTNSVTEQALKGIYTYMGKEEGGLRSSVFGLGKTIDGVVK